MSNAGKQKDGKSVKFDSLAAESQSSARWFHAEDPPSTSSSVVEELAIARRTSLFPAVIVENTFSTENRSSSSFLMDSPLPSSSKPRPSLSMTHQKGPGFPSSSSQHPSSFDRSQALFPSSLSFRKEPLPTEDQSTIPLPVAPLDLEVRYFYIPFVSGKRNARHPLPLKPVRLKACTYRRPPNTRSVPSPDLGVK